MRAGGFEEWLRPRARQGAGRGRLVRLPRAARGARPAFCAEALAHHAVFPRRGPATPPSARRLRYFPAMAARMPELRDAPSCIAARSSTSARRASTSRWPRCARARRAPVAGRCGRRRGVRTCARCAATRAARARGAAGRARPSRPPTSRPTWWGSPRCWPVALGYRSPVLCSGRMRADTLRAGMLLAGRAAGARAPAGSHGPPTGARCGGARRAGARYGDGVQPRFTEAARSHGRRRCRRPRERSGCRPATRHAASARLAVARRGRHAGAAAGRVHSELVDLAGAPVPRPQRAAANGERERGATAPPPTPRVLTYRSARR